MEIVQTYRPQGLQRCRRPASWLLLAGCATQGGLHRGLRLRMTAACKRTLTLYLVSQICLAFCMAVTNPGLCKAGDSTFRSSHCPVGRGGSDNRSPRPCRTVVSFRLGVDAHAERQMKPGWTPRVRKMVVCCKTSRNTILSPSGVAVAQRGANRSLAHTVQPCSTTPSLSSTTAQKAEA